MSPTEEIWVGTTGGIACLENNSWALQKPWESFIATDTLKVFCVDSICFDNDNAVWAATRGAGVHYYDGFVWEENNPLQYEYSHGGTSMAITPDGNIWFGDVSGLYRHDGSTWSQFDLPEDWEKPYIHNLSVGPDGALWVSGFGVFARYDNSSWTSWTEFSDELRMADIACVYGRSLSDIWIGTSSGLYHYNGEDLHRYITIDDHTVIVIHDICAMGNGLLFATDYGILQYNVQSMTFKEVVPDFISAIDQNDSPLQFDLEATAFPNPFNPSTTLSFNLPQPADITLTVYAITGQKVAALAEGRFSAGTHMGCIRRSTSGFGNLHLPVGVGECRKKRQDAAHEVIVRIAEEREAPVHWPGLFM